MKSAKFKEDSNAVLSYQLHALAVKSYLEKSPTGETKRPPKSEAAVVVRARRQAQFYRRLAILARVFPLVIGVACLGILWDSQRRADHRRASSFAVASESQARAAGTLPSGESEEALSRSHAITPRRAVSSIDESFSSHLQTLLRAEPTRHDGASEAPPPMASP